MFCTYSGEHGEAPHLHSTQTRLLYEMTFKYTARQVGILEAYFMTFRINEDAANHQDSVLGHVRSFRSYIKWKPDSYLSHNVYRILLLPVSECRLKFDLISMSRI